MILLDGGTLLDGLGSEPARGDVLIDGERIGALGRIEAGPDVQRIDCSGLCVAPGFIDAHSHSDLQALDDRREKLAQGVTTEVVGNCGFSAFPATAFRGELHEFANGILRGTGDWGWPGAAEYLEAAALAPHANIISLVGHGTLRIAVAGLRQGALAAREVEAMESMLDDALAAGAAGFSTGLMYAPGASAPGEELERLCRVTARRGKIYATHMRSYFSGVLAAIDEQLALARRTGVKLQISHLQLVGRANWPLQKRALEKIERAREEGIDVAFDCYPYTAGSTVLTQVLPQWALEGGVARLLERLADPALRARIAGETARTIEWDWRDILISAGAEGLIGKSIAEIATERGATPADTVLDLLEAGRGQVNMLSFNQSEENLLETLAHPLSLVISDGFYVDGRPHPRLYGTFPRLLGAYVRERRAMSLADAVRKITGAPAARFGISGRGVLAPGAVADITVFDPATIGSAADYEHPERTPVGIRAVLRRGRPAL